MTIKSRYTLLSSFNFCYAPCKGKGILPKQYTRYTRGVHPNPASDWSVITVLLQLQVVVRAEIEYGISTGFSGVIHTEYAYQPLRDHDC